MICFYICSSSAYEEATILVSMYRNIISAMFCLVIMTHRDFVLLWCNVQTPDEYQTQPKEKPAQHMFSAAPRSEPRRLLIPAVSMKVRNSLDFLFLLFFVEVPFEVCHGCFTMTCMDVLKRNTVRNIFLSLKSPAIFNLIATAGFIVQPCWQHLSVSHTHSFTCVSDTHYSCSVYLISSIISCQISAARRYCSVSAFSEMYSLLLSVQQLNVPKMTRRFNLGWFLLCFMSFWSFSSLTTNHVYANVEYKLTFSLYILKNLLKVSSLYYFAFRSKGDCFENRYSSHLM